MFSIHNLFLAKAAFNYDTMKTVLGTESSYKCGGNYFWHNVQYQASPGVPVNVNAVQNLVDTTFADPCRLSLNLKIAIPTMDTDPMTQRGALMSVAPDEVRFAYALAIMRDIESKVSSERTER